MPITGLSGLTLTSASGRVVDVDAHRLELPAGDRGGGAGVGRAARGAEGHRAGELRGRRPDPGHHALLLVGADRQRDVRARADGRALQAVGQAGDLGRVLDAVGPGEVDDPAEVVLAHDLRRARRRRTAAGCARPGSSRRSRRRSGRTAGRPSPASTSAAGRRRPSAPGPAAPRRAGPGRARRSRAPRPPPRAEGDGTGGAGREHSTGDQGLRHDASGVHVNDSHQYSTRWKLVTDSAEGSRPLGTTQTDS